MDGIELTPRLQIATIASRRRINTLADDARAGLLSTPRTLPAKYFYDERGAQLFEDICATEDYYPSRAEASLLREHGEALVKAMDAAHWVELGSGSSRKTRHLLRHAQAGTTYWPFDVSEQMLRDAAAELVTDMPDLIVHGLVGDYHAGLELPLPDQGRRAVLFLGGTLGNFKPEQAQSFLRDIRGMLRPGDVLLLGADRVKDSAVLERAYDDRDGVTAQFNLNVLTVLNRRLAADFDPRQFRHRAIYNRQAQRIEMYLEARQAQQVRIGALDIELTLAAGERIRTELSHKYTPQTLEQLLAPAGFLVEELLTTAAPNTYSLVLARACE
ncbi:L-histidine N(alpha)-methyltransferase [Abyssibacter sp.]|jgi:L-histidine N-alpha-methyltransferase|uniref:L-histidine N(alpha)-methyltransferase n=1 Tax=Abyssibacter sp. TaxID=2320200 RepID=UPI0035126C7C